MNFNLLSYTDLWNLGSDMIREEARKKIIRYCAYQERCHSEVEEKLKLYELSEEEQGEIIIELIRENFLNEERFACAFVSGKFRIKQWGKNKIRMELERKEVSDFCIQKGMEEIDDEEYLKTLKKIMDKKKSTIKSSNQYEQKFKLSKYLISKGYEPELVWQLIEVSSVQNERNR